MARTLNPIASADAVSTATATALRITRHGGTEGAAKTALWNGWLGEIPHCLWTNHHVLLVKSTNLNGEITIFGGVYVLIVAGEIRMIVLYSLILGFDPKLYVG